MTIALDCPGCGHRLRYKDEAAGKRLQCHLCKHMVTVPVQSSPTATQAPEPAADADSSTGTAIYTVAHPQRVILVGVQMDLTEILVLAFKWSVAVFLLSVGYGFILGVLYLIFRTGGS